MSTKTYEKIVFVLKIAILYFGIQIIKVLFEQNKSGLAYLASVIIFSIVTITIKIKYTYEFTFIVDNLVNDTQVTLSESFDNEDFKDTYISNLKKCFEEENKDIDIKNIELVNNIYDICFLNIRIMRLMYEYK